MNMTTEKHTEEHTEERTDVPPVNKKAKGKT